MLILNKLLEGGATRHWLEASGHTLARTRVPGRSHGRSTAGASAGQVQGLAGEQGRQAWLAADEQVAGGGDGRSGRSRLPWLRGWAAVAGVGQSDGEWGRTQGGRAAAGHASADASGAAGKPRCAAGAGTPEAQAAMKEGRSRDAASDSGAATSGSAAAGQAGQQLEQAVAQAARSNGSSRATA